MSEELRIWIVNVLTELQKHAERDECYSCKQLLKSSLVKPFLEAMKE